jgi:NAD(P)-dependent dehydrogenase (short-subunit alcohol dehydrogenase family)
MRAVWDTSVFGVLAVYQAMLPILRKRLGARIVNVSSGVGSLTKNLDPPPKPLMPDPIEWAKDRGATNGLNGHDGGGFNM